MYNRNLNKYLNCIFFMNVFFLVEKKILEIKKL
jgi:hypothetical protein